MRSRFSNPVLQKEFKLRFRTGKSFAGVFIYLFILGVLALGYMYVVSLGQSHLFFQPDESRGLFLYLSIIQLIMLLFITPGLTAGVISGERERQTLNMLLTTTVSSFQIITGKLIASIAYLLLLLVASLPLFSFVFLFGGVAPSEVLFVFLVYIITVLTFGSIGIMFSTLLQRTIAAVITSYVVTLFLTMGTVILFFISFGISIGLHLGGDPVLPYFIASLNPVLAVFNVMEGDLSYSLIGFYSMFELPIWIMFIINYSLIFILCTWISTWRLRKAK